MEDKLRQYYQSTLSELYNHNECTTLYRTFVSEVLGIPFSQTYFCKDNDFTPKQITELKTIAQKLANGMPYQYILGWTEIGGLRWKVTPDVLIPRPETAELIDYICQTKQEVNSILDICTGSGFIAISLALKYPTAKVCAIDISKSALQIAQDNALAHQTNIQFIQEDALSISDTSLTKKYDLIVSNPPYICNSEKQIMQKQVIDYEPNIALFVPDNNPLIFYQNIAQYAKTILNDNGTLWFEINERLGEQTCKCLNARGFKTSLYRDMFNKDRFIKAQLRS